MEFIDLKRQYEAYRADIDQKILSAIASAEFIGGGFVDELEEQLADYVGRRHCISCGNGTDALQLAYMAYGIRPGDAVFCPDMTFISSVEPAVMLGAEPVFCDIDPSSYNLDPNSLESRIAETEREGRLRPRFVVCVDFLGNPANYEAICRICDKHGLVLIEDAAQGIGGMRKGKKLGSFGDISTTSFFPSKPLGCYGDGGAVFVDDDGVASLIRSIKVHGKGSSKYDNVRIGVNSRLDNIQAAVLCEKLKHLDDEMSVRQEVAEKYRESLSDRIKCPYVEDGDRSAFAQYVLLANDESDRKTIIEHLARAGIPSLIYYPRTMQQMKAFEGIATNSNPIASSYARRNFGLPFSAFLLPSDQNEVIQIISAAITPDAACN